MSSATTAAASGDASSGCVPCATMDVSHVLEPEDIRQVHFSHYLLFVVANNDRTWLPWVRL